MEIAKRDKSYDFIRAFAIILIVVWHFWTTCREQGIGLPIKPLCETLNVDEMVLNEGVIGVALFFILSGAVLMTRYRDELKIGQFFKRRVIRIFIPLWISFIIMFIILCILYDNVWENTNKLGLFTSFMGLDLFGATNMPTFWLVGEWFTTVIIMMYILFPLLRLMLKKIPILSTILITGIFVANIHLQILTYGEGWFSITNSLMVFWIGMLIGYYKPKFKWGMFITGIIGIVLTSIFAKQLSNFMFYTTNLLFSSFLFMILGVINYSNKLTNFLSKYNFEIYLLHHRILIWTLPLLSATFTSSIKELLIFVVLFWFICGCSKLLNIIVAQITKFCEWLKTKIIKLCSKKSNKKIKPS